MVRVCCLAVCIGLLLSAVPVSAQSPGGAAPSAGIAYPSVAAAQAALRGKNGVKFSSNDGWVIANDTDGTIWSFTPSSHPAHPSVGQRKLVQQDGRFFVETRILCQAQKPACDKLKGDYELLDRRMNEAMRTGK